MKETESGRSKSKGKAELSCFIPNLLHSCLLKALLSPSGPPSSSSPYSLCKDRGHCCVVILQVSTRVCNIVLRFKQQQQQHHHNKAYHNLYYHNINTKHAYIDVDYVCNNLHTQTFVCMATWFPLIYFIKT